MRDLLEQYLPQLQAQIEPQFTPQFPKTRFHGYVADLLAAFPPQAAASADVSAMMDTLIEPLTECELEVLGLLCQGLSNREIADLLVLSVGTVKTHIHNIFGKLGVGNRPQAIAKASRLGVGADSRNIP
jgi:LuxR family maltose regulon positive regulatory protein